VTSTTSPRARGFTLLEVLVAVAILSLGLTMILSSQVGLFASASRGEHLTVATNLARCKMGELELELLKKGYPGTDTKDDGRCCGDDSDSAYTCEWKIERVTLPDQSADGGAMDASLGPLAALGNLGAQGSNAGGNPISALMGGGLGPSPMGSASTPQTLQGIAENVSSNAAMTGIGPMVMTMVYPGLKPMLEASIRKITLRVKWKEGVRERDIVITQYVTDPQQAGLNSDGGLGGIAGGIPGQIPGQTTPGQTTPGQTTPGQTTTGRGLGR